jgi:hypothetical protein
VEGGGEVFEFGWASVEEVGGEGPEHGFEFVGAGSFGAEVEDFGAAAAGIFGGDGELGCMAAGEVGEIMDGTPAGGVGAGFIAPLGVGVEPGAVDPDLRIVDAGDEAGEVEAALDLAVFFGRGEAGEVAGDGGFELAGADSPRRIHHQERAGVEAADGRDLPVVVVLQAGEIPGDPAAGGGVIGGRVAGFPAGHGARGYSCGKAGLGALGDGVEGPVAVGVFGVGGVGVVQFAIPAAAETDGGPVGAEFAEEGGEVGGVAGADGGVEDGVGDVFAGGVVNVEIAVLVLVAGVGEVEQPGGRILDAGVEDDLQAGVAVGGEFGEKLADVGGVGGAGGGFEVFPGDGEDDLGDAGVGERPGVGGLGLEDAEADGFGGGRGDEFGDEKSEDEDEDEDEAGNGAGHGHARAEDGGLATKSTRRHKRGRSEEGAGSCGDGIFNHETHERRKSEEELFHRAEPEFGREGTELGGRRTEGWPQKAQEGTKGGDRRRGWSFLTMAERGSAEVVTLISVARNEVEGD